LVYPANPTLSAMSARLSVRGLIQRPSGMPALDRRRAVEVARLTTVTVAGHQAQLLRWESPHRHRGWPPPARAVAATPPFRELVMRQSSPMRRSPSAARTTTLSARAGWGRPATPTPWSLTGSENP